MKRVFSLFKIFKFLEIAVDKIDNHLNYIDIFRNIGINRIHSTLCIILIYFQSSPYMLLVVSLIIKNFLSYLNFFMGVKVCDILPDNIFQIVGMTVYILLALSTLFNLMIWDGSLNTIPKTKKKLNDRVIGKILLSLNLKDIDAIVKIAGILLISIHEEQSNFVPMISDKWISIAAEALTNLISVLIAIFVGYCFSIKFSLNTNLLLTSITFLLMGIYTAVKVFSQF